MYRRSVVYIFPYKPPILVTRVDGAFIPRFHLAPVNEDGPTPVIIPMAVASVQRLGHRALGKLEPPSRAVPRAGNGVIHPNYPRLSAGFGFRSRGSASGAGPQPNTLRPP